MVSHYHYDNQWATNYSTTDHGTELMTRYNIKLPYNALSLGVEYKLDDSQRSSFEILMCDMVYTKHLNV